MGKKSGSSVQKRRRELKRAEKAQIKRDRRLEPKEERDSQVATQDDLAGYGYVPDEETEDANH